MSSRVHSQSPLPHSQPKSFKGERKYYDKKKDKKNESEKNKTSCPGRNVNG